MDQLELALLHSSEEGTLSEDQVSEVRQMQQQVKALHSSNQKIIAAAQEQVAAMHDRYQEFEKMFRACIGDSLTRLASPPGSPVRVHGTVDSVWQRGEETVPYDDEHL